MAPIKFSRWALLCGCSEVIWCFKLIKVNDTEV